MHGLYSPSLFCMISPTGSTSRCHKAKMRLRFKIDTVSLEDASTSKKVLKLSTIGSTDSGWLVGGSCKGGITGSFSALRDIYRKARGAVSLDTIFSLKNWRLWYGYALEDFRSNRRRTPSTVPPTAISATDAFTEKNRITTRAHTLLETSQATFSYSPTISILMPVYNVEPQLLTEAIESVREQIYPHWELCIADDASSRSETLDVLKQYEGDPRMKIVFREQNGHICRATNSAADLATGEFVALLDNDDLLAPHALFEMVRLLQKHPEADLIYSDEDKIDMAGHHYDLHFKPDWSPALLLGFNYINHLTCLRRSLFEEVGRFRPGYEGAQDYDLLLRATERSEKVFHIPKILYHWRAVPGSTALKSTEKSIVSSSAELILREALERRGIAARIYLPEFAQKLRVPVQQLDWPDHGPSVDIIIPTLNRVDLLRVCVQSILDKTSYRNHRIVVVDNGSDCAETLAWLRRMDKHGIRVERILNDESGFSFSRINNLAVARSDAELVLFLNNDTEVVDPKWLSRLVGYLGLPGVGATGARLLYPNGTIQHAGVVLGMGGGFIPDHAFCRLPASAPGYFFLAHTSRECSAVTGACLLVRRQDFLQVGGFDEERFRISLNDVDLCLKLGRAGLRTVYVAGAELIHHESLTRSREDDPAELANFRDKYQGTSDPFYSPNLSRRDSYAILPESTLDYGELRQRPLRVFFFSHNLNHEGAPKILAFVARSLKNRGTVQPVVISFCDGPLRVELEEAGVEVQILKVREEENILLRWADREELENATEMVAALLRRETPDVVVSNVLNTFFVVDAAHKVAIPSVWWIHESYDRSLMARNIPALALPRCEAAFEKASSVLFVSRDTAALYARYNTRQNFKVIHNSIDTAAIRELVTPEHRSAARCALGIDANRKVIVSVGTVCERKDQRTLVEACRLLAQARQDFVCYLIGYRESYPYGPYLKRQVEQLGLSDFIKLIPETSDVATYYLAADIFAFSSLNESYSLTVLEAMGFGLPIVTTPCFGVSEQVRYGVNALPFDFKDSGALARQLAALLDDDAKRTKMGRNSREMMRYMQSREEMLDKHEALLLSCSTGSLRQVVKKV